MTKFIPVTYVDTNDGERRPCGVNVDYIVSYMPTYGAVGTFIDTVDGKTMRVAEKFADIDRLIKAS